MNGSIKEEILQLLDNQTENAWSGFSKELNDENEDYRRGFRAGRLVSALEMKSDVLCMLELEQKYEE